MSWTKYTDEHPDLARDHYRRDSSGQVLIVHREIEARYRALYGPHLCGEWTYEKPEGFE